VRKREFAPGVQTLGFAALIPALSAAVISQLTNKADIVYVVAAGLALMLCGWAAYGLQRFRAFRRHRRESDVLRRQGEVALHRFADSLAIRD
jgi:hypothetical protein